VGSNDTMCIQSLLKITHIVQKSYGAQTDTWTQWYHMPNTECMCQHVHNVCWAFGPNMKHTHSSQKKNGQLLLYIQNLLACQQSHFIKGCLKF